MFSEVALSPMLSPYISPAPAKKISIYNTRHISGVTFSAVIIPWPSLMTSPTNSCPWIMGGSTQHGVLPSPVNINDLHSTLVIMDIYPSILQLPRSILHHLRIFQLPEPLPEPLLPPRQAQVDSRSRTLLHRRDPKENDQMTDGKMYKRTTGNVAHLQIGI